MTYCNLFEVGLLTLGKTRRINSESMKSGCNQEDGKTRGGGALLYPCRNGEDQEELAIETPFFNGKRGFLWKAIYIEKGHCPLSGFN